MQPPIFPLSGAATQIAEHIATQLATGVRVLWLVPGGSNIALAATIGNLLAATPNIHNLTISLTDERHGPVGHPESNWQQLLDAGFAVPGATLCPVLSGDDLTETAASFEHFLAEALVNHNYCIGLFGLGSDGHTSGILPHSPALTTQGLVSAYQSTPYTRITTTAAAITQLDATFLVAEAATKQTALDQLLAPSGDTTATPARILLDTPLTIFTDYQPH